MSSTQDPGVNLDALLNSPEEGPVSIVNMVKLKPDGGLEGYAKYSAAAAPFVIKYGARIGYYLGVTEDIGGGDGWDIIYVLEYPNRKAFVDMINDPGYAELHDLRESSIVRAAIYAGNHVDGIQDLLAKK